MGKNVVGLDLGFVQLKGVGDGWEDICPSLSKRRSEVIMGGLNDSEGYLVTTKENGSWNVGAKGSFDFKPERLVASDLPKFYTMLGLYQAATGQAIIDLLVSGLPVEEYKREEDKNTFASRLKGNFGFGFGTEERLIQIKKSLVLPQSAGAFFDFILDDAGDEQNTELASESILMLDIGGKSTDGCIMEDGAFSQDSFTVWEGVYKVQEELRRLISNRLNYLAWPFEVSKALKTGTIKLSGDEVDISDLIKTAVKTRLYNFTAELTSNISDFRRFSAVVLCGGGANLYAEYLQEFINTKLSALENAEFANANGYYKYGCLKLAEGLI